MTFAETTAFLREFNRWRRGGYDQQPPRAHEVGEAIDAACAYMEDMRYYREMAEDLLEKNAKQAVTLVRLKNALQEIATLDTSPLTSTSRPARN